MRHEPYLADQVPRALRRRGPEVVVDHQPLPPARLAFAAAPDAHMAEPGIALLRARLPGAEAQVNLDGDLLAVDRFEAVACLVVPAPPGEVVQYPRAIDKAVGQAGIGRASCEETWCRNV